MTNAQFHVPHVRILISVHLAHKDFSLKKLITLKQGSALLVMRSINAKLAKILKLNVQAVFLGMT